MQTYEENHCRNGNGFRTGKHKAELIQPIVLWYYLQAHGQHTQREQCQKKRENK
jgi:hypothetical protein